MFTPTSRFEGKQQDDSKHRSKATVNLEKSIQLLDQSVGLTNSLGILRTKPSPSLYKGFTGVYDNSMSAQTNANTTMLGVGDQTMAMFLTTNSFLQKPDSNTTFMDEDMTTTNVALLLEEDPGIAASTALFGDFMTSMQENASEHQIFELLNRYEDTCDHQVTLLSKLVTRIANGSTKIDKVRQMIDLLKQERCTWSLLNSLYKDRLETEQKLEDIHAEESMIVDSLNKRLSEKQIVQNLYKKESSVRQAQIVIDWLERSIDDCYDKIQFFTDQTGSWEHTLHALQKKKSGILMGADRPIVASMDPDAPIREQRPLADLDQEDEARLLKTILLCIRAGKLEEAQTLCTRCGQSWRAATLEGWRLYHDPNYESEETTTDMDTVQNVEGNNYRDVWKNVCWNMAQDDKLSMEERSIYAALSGNLQGLLPACLSWRDQVWAFFKTMVDQRVEQEVRVHTSNERNLQDLPEMYWNQVLSVEGIFREIQASPFDNIRAQSKLRYNVIQKYIILGDTEALIEEMYEWCKDEVASPPKHLVRFMAHLVLFFRTLGMTTKEDICVSILEAYVKCLVNDRQLPLVATYVSTLPQTLQVEWYAHFLEGITDSDERQECLKLASEAGLDIPVITKHLVENIRSRDWPDYNTTATDMPHDIATTQDDRDKIDSIDWLVFDPSQRSEAIKQANAVMRTFLAMRKHTAAREVFNKIPSDSLDLVIKSWQAKTGTTELSPQDDNAIKEYLCIKAYLDAQESFNDWFEHFHNAKPKQPAYAPGADFTERVYQEHKQKQHDGELNRWQYSLGIQTKTTVDRIYNVLLFVDGGWMVDRNTDGTVDESRQHQMMLTRQLCIPTMCMLLLTVLHSSAHYKECLTLADVIVSEEHQLYRVFNKEELQKFLQKLQESAVANLEENYGPLGHPLT